MIEGIQYNYYKNDILNKTFIVSGGFDTHKVYLDMGCFESQAISPIAVWRIKKDSFFKSLIKRIKWIMGNKQA
jgi:hypothetical protein